MRDLRRPAAHADDLRCLLCADDPARDLTAAFRRINREDAAAGVWLCNRCREALKIALSIPYQSDDVPTREVNT